MQSRSPSDRRSSTSGIAARSLAGACAAAALGVAALAVGLAPASALALALAAAAIAGWAGQLTGRGWRRRLTGELATQAAFVDRLTQALSSVSGTLEPSRVLEAAAAEAQTLFAADAALLLVPDGARLRPAAARGIALGLAQPCLCEQRLDPLEEQGVGERTPGQVGEDTRQ